MHAGGISAVLDESLEASGVGAGYFAVAFEEKIRVTFMDLPREIISSMATSPGKVAGILTKRLGLSTISCSRVASSTVASVS